MRFVNYCIPFLFTICSVPTFLESGLYVFPPFYSSSFLWKRRQFSLVPHEVQRSRGTSRSSQITRFTSCNYEFYEDMSAFYKLVSRNMVITIWCGRTFSLFTNAFRLLPVDDFYFYYASRVSYCIFIAKITVESVPMLCFWWSSWIKFLSSIVPPSVCFLLILRDSCFTLGVNRQKRCIIVMFSMTYYLQFKAALKNVLFGQNTQILGRTIN